MPHQMHYAQRTHWAHAWVRAFTSRRPRIITSSSSFNAPSAHRRRPSDRIRSTVRSGRRCTVSEFAPLCIRASPASRCAFSCALVDARVDTVDRGTTTHLLRPRSSCPSSPFCAPDWTIPSLSDAACSGPLQRSLIEYLPIAAGLIMALRPSSFAG